MKEMKQKRSTRKRIVETTKDYSSATTIHGITYLTGDDTTAVERLLWLVVVILAILLATYQVVNLYKDWQDDPVVTTLDTVALPIEEIDFPAVTICPQGSRQEIVDLVLFRQLTEYIERTADNVTMLTEEQMVEQVVAFLNNVYPGAKGKPTKLTKMMTSDDPTVSITNDAVLGLEEECDASSNADMVEALNKKLKNDTCPKDFEMAKESNYCIHKASTPMDYNEASKYCNDLSGSSLLYLDTYQDIDPLRESLEFSGSIVILSIVREDYTKISNIKLKHLLFLFYPASSCACKDPSRDCKVSNPEIKTQFDHNYCYVEQPSSCYDLAEQDEEDGKEKYSAQACWNGICITIMPCIKSV